MMQRPWDCAQPDEWLPRSLRLCWGGDGGGGFGGDSGGGWSGDSGGGATTGGGDWGSSGSYDASGYNAGGDLGAWAGSAYDASTAGTGMGGGGDWGSFGDTSYGSFNAPNPIFTDVAGPNPGVTTGGGDWGSAGMFSAAGTGGGPGGAMFGADLGAGAGAPGQLSGGGLFGDYGAGGGGGFYGGGGLYGGGGGLFGGGGSTYGGGGGGYTGGGGGKGGGAFGGFGSAGTSSGGRSGGPLGASNVVAATPTASRGETLADTVGGGSLAGPGGKTSSDAPTRSEAEVESAGDPDATDPDSSPSDFGKPAESETAAPEAAPEAPEAQPGPSLTDAAPAGMIGGPQDAAPTSAGGTIAPAQSAFGPQSLNTDYQGSPYASDYDQGASSQSALSSDYGYDYSGSPYASNFDQGAAPSQAPASDWGQQPYAGPFAGPDVVADRGGPYDTAFPGEQGGGLGVNWGSVFEGANPGAQSFWGDIANQAQSRADQFWSNLTDPSPMGGKDPSALGTWFSTTNQPTVSAIYNFLTQGPGGSWGQTQAAMANSQYAGPLAGPDVIGNRGEQNQAPSGPYAGPFAGPDVMADGRGTALDDASLDAAAAAAIQNTDYSNLANEAGPDWGAVFEGAAAAPTSPDWGAVFEGPELGPDYASVFEGTPSSPDWTSVFEGAPSVDPTPTTSPSVDLTMESGPPGVPTTTDDAATPGSDPALSGYPAEATPGQPGTAPPGAPPQQGGSLVVQTEAPNAVANAASNAALNVNAPPAVVDAASQAAYNAALNLAPPAEQANAAREAALQAGATQQQADTIATATLAAATNPTAAPPAQPQQAPLGPEQAGAPSGQQAFISGGRATNFDYLTQAPPAPPAPSLIEQAQTAPPGVPMPQSRPSDAPPGLVDMQPSVPTPQARPPDAPQPQGIEPGAEQYGVSDDDHDAPEPGDTSEPEADPNAPRPSAGVPGQVIGSRGDYAHEQNDNPRTNRNYLNSGRTDYPQGRPGITFRSARQAGVTPLFRVGDINVHDLAAPLIENINRALQDMERTTGIPANSLVSTSGYRPAHRGEAHERMMDERTSQESVKSRYFANGRSFGPAASPGNSNHGPGRAIDFSSKGESGRALAWLRAHAGEYGLMHLGFKNGKPYDVPHIQLRPGVNVPRPSAQEQAEQRAIDAQNRQASAGRGQAPVQQARAAVPPGGWRGIGSDRADIPWTQQPDVAQPRPPADIPPAAGLPPEPPAPSPVAPRPLADIPARGPNEFDIPVTPPVRNATVIANNILKQATAHLNKDSGQAAFQAASVVAAKALAAAGIPANLARSLMTKGALDGAIANGYGPGGPNSTVMGFSIWGKVQSSIAEGVDAAMQGYQPAKPGELRGPPAPAQQRSQAPSGGLFHFAAGPKDAYEEQADLPLAPDAELQPGMPEWGTAPRSPDLFGPPETLMPPPPPALRDPNELGAEPGFTISRPSTERQASLLDYLQGNSIRALAKGGRVAGDEPVVVGEEGPEYFVPDRPGTVVPHMPQPQVQPGRNIDRWPKLPAVNYPGQYGGVEREMMRQTRSAQDPVPSLMDMIDREQLRLNAANWHRMINDPSLIALGRSRIEDRR